MKDRILIAAAAGLFLGLVAAVAEWLHVGLFVRGAGFQPLILVYAELVDGGVGLLVGILGGIVWSAILWLRRPKPPGRPTEAVRSVWGEGPHQVMVVLRRHGMPPPAPPAAEPAVSRRTALKLGAATFSAGVLGLGVLALTTKLRQTSGAGRPDTAYAYAPTGAISRTPDVLDLSSRQAAASPAAQSTPTAAPQRLNIVLVTLDTVRADQLGVYGHPFVKTPALDRLASQSARFDMHMVQEPATNPSHASIFSGMYPPSNGVLVHMVDKLPASIETLADLFGKAGYYTAGLYSWMSLDDQYCGLERGFQSYQNVAGGMPGVLGQPLLRKVTAEYRVAEQYLAVPRGVSDVSGVQEQLEWKNKGRADVTTDAAIAKLGMLSSEPCFLWVHYFDGHYPYVPPSPYDTQYDATYHGKLTFDMDTLQSIEKGRLQPTAEDTKRLMSLYQGEISFLDANLRRLFAAIDRPGIADNTALVVTADHGESFGEHSTLKEDTDYFHPHDLYNAEQRVPLFVRVPGRVKPGSVVKAPTQALDLFPTLLELAGIEIPEQSQGRGLLRLLDGDESGAARAAYSVMPDYVFTSVTVPGWKYILNTASGTHELYDLRSDPDEAHDLSASHADVAKDLSGKLQGWMKAVKIV